MDLGFVTHAVHDNSRLVYLKPIEVTEDEVTFMAPPSKDIYPPGPGFIFCLVNGIPSEGRKIMVGDGRSPPANEETRK